MFKSLRILFWTEEDLREIEEIAKACKSGRMKVYTFEEERRGLVSNEIYSSSYRTGRSRI